ncbi:hypothetical protein ACUNV4_18275 [Granulosicoccus sp. 3-233]|uniref:hypothetical protein n=1 Tax=Granulosicoccus sp. 3-233 TaxID=3417969 RepID=UPI003D32FA88
MDKQFFLQHRFLRLPLDYHVAFAFFASTADPALHWLPDDCQPTYRKTTDQFQEIITMMFHNGTFAVVQALPGVC